MARNAKTETRNIALTIDGETLIVPAAKLETAKKWARQCADDGSTVSLKWTTEPTTAKAREVESLEAINRRALESDLHTLRMIGHEDDDGQAYEDAITSGLIRDSSEIGSKIAKIERQLRAL